MKIFWYDSSDELRNIDIDAGSIFEFLKILSREQKIDAESVFWVHNGMFVQYDLYYNEIIDYKPVRECTLNSIRKAVSSPATLRSTQG